MTATATDQSLVADQPTTPPTPRPHRWLELGLLVLALVIGLGGFALASLRLTDAFPEDFGQCAIVSVTVVLLVHIALWIRAPWADQVILPVIVALNGMGLSMIYRLDLGNTLVGKPTDLAGSQFQWTVIGMVCAAGIVFFLKDHRVLRKYTFTAMTVGIVLILLPLVPGLGTEIHGARIWIRIAGNSLQPAEFAKIAFAIFFAGYLVKNRDTLTLAGPKFLGMQLPRVRDLGPILLVWLVSLAVLIFEKDLGTSLLFFGLFVAVLYVATERFSWVAIGLVLIAVGAALAASSMGHVQARFDVWLHAFEPEIYNRDPGGSYQVVQGLFGMANGGLFGTGWGNGYPRIVPFSASDLVYASLGEEIGLIGLMAILMAYLVFTERGLRTAVSVRDGFGKLLAGGLAFVTAWQVFIVIGGITRVIPLTGLTLPFVAHGGSSLLANWMIVGLLLRISHNARQPSALPTRGEIAAGGVRHREDAPIVVGPDGDPGHHDALPSDDNPTVVGVLSPDGVPDVHDQPTVAHVLPSGDQPTVAGIVPIDGTPPAAPPDGQATVAVPPPPDAHPERPWSSS